MFNLPDKPKIKLKARLPDQRKIAVIPLRALRDKTLWNGAIRVLGLVCSYANRAGITWVSQDRLAEELGITRSGVTHYITHLRNKGYIERIKKGKKLRFTSTMRIIYDEELTLEDALGIASGDEDLRSPMMIEREEEEMVRKAAKTSRKAVKTLGEYVDTKIANESLGEAYITYNSKFEIVEELYLKVYKEKKVINELDMKAIEIADAIGLANEEFGRGLELWLRARDQAPQSIIDYVRGL